MFEAGYGSFAQGYFGLHGGEEDISTFMVQVFYSKFELWYGP
jgi:hypothetical protein